MSENVYLLISALGGGVLGSIATALFQYLSARPKNHAEAETTLAKGYSNLAVDLQKQIDKLDVKYVLLERKHDILKENYERLDDKYERLKRNYDDLRSEYESLQQQCTKLESENAALKTRIFDLETELTAYKHPQLT